MTVCVVHLSDIHFGGENAAAAEAAIDAVARLAPNAVVVTGDLTLNGLPAEFESARRWLSRLGGPQVVTPGNHDTPYWNLPLRALTPFGRYRRFIGEPERAALDGPGVAVRALNSARGFQMRPNWSKGSIDLSQADRAASELAGCAGCLKVFACHHPLIDLPGMPVTGGVHRGLPAAERLIGAGVDMILTGHTHVPFALQVNAGSGASYAIGAGTLSQRTRGAPPSFMAIEAGRSRLQVSAMTWTGRDFETGETWELPRPAGGR